MIVNECVHAYQSTLVATAADSTYRTLGMDSEVVDSGGFHDNVTNNSRLTFPSGGVFLVFGAPAWNNPTQEVYGRLTKNGTSVGYEYNVSGFAAGPTSLAGPFLFWLENFAANDRMESQGWCNAGGTPGAWTQMCALKVDEWSCSVGATANQSVGISSEVILTFANVLYDPHSMATATDRIEVKKAGYYLVLSSANGESRTEIKKNGSSTVLKGSQGGGHDGQARGSIDYVVDWFEVGDYVRVSLYGADRTLTVNYRQFMMVYLGGPNSALAYVYSSVDIRNSDPGFITGILRFDTEWFDTGSGHPGGTGNGSFNMAAGYHFVLAKLVTSPGGFTNDGLRTVLNLGDLSNNFSTTRHVGQGGTMSFACFSAASGDTVTTNWFASGNFVEVAHTVWTNAFVTDAGFVPLFTSFDFELHG